MTRVAFDPSRSLIIIKATFMDRAGPARSIWHWTLVRAPRRSQPTSPLEKRIRASSVPSKPSKESTVKWAIRAQRLFDGAGRAVMRDAVVVIEDSHIAALGPAAQVPLDAGSQVVDVGDRTVMPGLIDAHVHILLTGSAISGQESRDMTDHQVLLVGARNAQFALKSGLTT